MPTTQTDNPPTFESVWAALQETDRIVKEIAESQKETERFIKEYRQSQREAAERQEEYAQQQAKRQEEYAQQQAKRQEEADERRKEYEKRRIEEQKKHEQERKEYEKQRTEEQKKREQERKEYEKQRTEEQKKHEQERKEYEQEQKKKNAEFYEKLGHLTTLFGDLTEAMVAPRIREKFEEIGLFFPKASRNIEFNDKVNNISFEVDIMLEDGDRAMLIEVKTKLTMERINYHLNRLDEMRKYADLRGDKRTFLGAVAGIVVTDEIRDYALNKGFYFIEYAGETFYITPPKNKPKEW